MNHRFKFAAIIAAMLFANAALACGQVACDETSRPGASVQIRGYGYGFEGGDRTVTLRWVADRLLAGTTRIDDNGDFIAHVVAPDSPGLHKLVVTVGDRDPAPVEITVPVVLPWYRQPMATLRTLPAELGVALAVLLVGGSGVAAYRQRSRQRRGEVAPGLSTHASAFGGSPPC